MTTDYLTKLAEAGEKATAGPWPAKEYSCGCCSYLDYPEMYVSNSKAALAPRDAAFIALARNTWAPLLDVVRAAEACFDKDLDVPGYQLRRELLEALTKLAAAVEGGGK